MKQAASLWHQNEVEKDRRKKTIIFGPIFAASVGTGLANFARLLLKWTMLGSEHPQFWTEICPSLTLKRHFSFLHIYSTNIY